MSRMKKHAALSLRAGLATALLIGTGGAAAAQELTVVGESIYEDILTERVSYADLKLASAADARALNLRVNGAVGRVCDPLDERGTLAQHRSCKSFAWNGARPQMAQAIARAQQLAAFGTSAIAPVAIVIAAPQR